MSAFRFKQALAAAAAVAAFAVYPVIMDGAQATAHAASHAARPFAASCANGNPSHGDVVLGSAAPGPLTFPSGCNGDGVNNCTGPVVGVYGASALKTFTVIAANDYCVGQLHGLYGLTQVSPNNAVDVEYLTGGDACPGDQWASNNATDQVLGVSGVFPPACAALVTPYNPNTVADSLVGVNVVESIAGCPGANVVQGGTPTQQSSPCLGLGDGNNDATMCAPNNESPASAILLWAGALGNYAPIGGCNTGTKVQQRAPGSGDKITWCANILGNPNLCNNTAPQPVANTQTDMFNDVCGNRFTGKSPADGPNAVGYTTRAAIVVDPRAPIGSPVPLADCGIVQLGGTDGWNRNCDPTAVTTGSPYSGFNNAENPPHIECNGDLQVITDQYINWGYEHFAVNSSVPTTGLAPTFANWVITHENQPGNGSPTGVSLDQAQGFMRTCQMNFKRTIDAGPLSGVTPTC